LKPIPIYQRLHMPENSNGKMVCDVLLPAGLLRRHRDFRRLWMGETISIFGSRMGDVAVSFAAVIAMSATPLQMGLLAAVRLVPKLLFSLIAGVWVDRLPRRPLMIGADLGRFALLVTIPVATMLGDLQMNFFYLAILAVGVLDLLFDVAYGAYLPSLVDPADVLEANSKLSASYAAAEVGGFAIAGWLVQILTAPYAILIDALSFVASALAIRTIAKPEIKITPRDNCRNFYHQALEGARVVAADQRLLALVRTNALAAFSYASLSTLYMLFVVRILGFAPGVLGMIFALGGVSSFFSSFGATRLVKRFGEGRALACGLVLQGISWICVPAARGATPLAASLLIAQQVFGDAGGTVAIITSTAIPQILVPGHILGRVRATISFATTTALIAGSLVAGLAAELAGLRPVMYVSAFGMAAAGVLLALAPVWSMAAHDLPMVGDGLIADPPHAFQV
jgi:MFS family permease